MNDNDLRNRLRELGAKKANKVSDRCEDTVVALEEGTTILMKKIRGHYFFGGPLFEKSRTEGKLLEIFQSLGLASSDSEGREALHLMTTTELPYSHDRYGNAVFSLGFDNNRRRYFSNLKQVDQSHPGCPRQHYNYWD